MALTGVYKGFSSFQYQKKKEFSLNDIELVKLDLLQHIFTRKGERVFMPTFGTLIPELTFEPLDEITLSVLEDELIAVFTFDPRVELLDLSIQTEIDMNRVTANVLLQYLEFNVSDTLDINIQFTD